jgi:hypothetical protein
MAPQPGDADDRLSGPPLILFSLGLFRIGGKHGYDNGAGHCYGKETIANR